MLQNKNAQTWRVVSPIRLLTFDTIFKFSIILKTPPPKKMMEGFSPKLRVIECRHFVTKVQWANTKLPVGLRYLIDNIYSNICEMPFLDLVTVYLKWMFNAPWTLGSGTSTCSIFFGMCRCWLENHPGTYLFWQCRYQFPSIFHPK